MSLREPTESVNASPGDRPGPAATPPRPTRAQRITAFAFLGAFATTIATVVLTGLWVRAPSRTTSVENPAVALTVDTPRTVNLLFESKAVLEDVEITLDLPAGIELQDRPGARRIAWQTRLAAGNNLLPLTVVARELRSGALAARLRQGDMQKTFVVDVSVSARGQP